MKEYKTIPEKYITHLRLVALFIPLPICKYQPDFAIKGYGFGATIAIQKVPLGLLMILLALLF